MKSLSGLALVFLLILCCPRLGAAEDRTVIKAPEGHAYTGAYVEFGERENEVTLEAIKEFEKLVQHRQAIVAFSDDWGLQSFPSRQLSIITGYGAIPLVYWLPWRDRRIDQEKPDGKENPYTLKSIARGDWDSYIDRWGAEAARFGKPFFVSFALEMNGDWFPWGGVHNGGGDREPGACERCGRGTVNFISSYRRIVDRVRAKGASNIVWVWHANNTSWPQGKWNEMVSYYPGPGYVDWLAMSAYGQQFPPPRQSNWISVEDAIVRPYRDLERVDRSKPVMIAEWGVGEFPKQGKKSDWIAEFFRRAPLELPRLHGAVFWHERWQNEDLQFSNLRVNSSREALEAYRSGVRNKFWLGRPFVTVHGSF